jgi:SAM-dependent methyltransferase
MEISNTEMAAAWEGEADHWVRAADRYDRASAFVWQTFLDDGHVAVTDRVLDVGCGTGQSSRDAGRLASAGSVLGLDINQRMLDEAAARTRREGPANVRYEWADAQVHPFDVAAFDVVISRYGVMFFADRLAAFANLAAALRPGGRLAVLVWQALDRNPWMVALRAALAVGRDLPSPPLGAPGPYGLADTDAVAAVLTEAGYESIAFVPIAGPLQLGRDPEDAWEYVRGMGLYRGLTGGLDETGKADAIANVKQLIADHTTSAGVMLDSASWSITAVRRPT